MYNQIMYRYYVTKRSPVSLWMLDDTTPFQEHSGSGNAAVVSAGTPTKSVPLVSGASFSSVFNNANRARFDNKLFTVGHEDRIFVLEAWILPVPKSDTGIQKVLSHEGARNDGITVDGKVIRFGTSYVNFGDAFCEFDMQEYGLAHVVGIHTPDENELWVNGERVASVSITEDQRADSFDISSDYLYAGETTSTQELALNAVAFYNSLSGEDIRRNYEAGIATLGQDSIFTQYGGSPLYLSIGDGSVFIEEEWVTGADFESGMKNNVEYSPERIRPAYDGDTSLAGDWTVSVPLDAQGDTSIYGVLISYTVNDATVEASLDGSSWTDVESGELLSIIPNGFDPTGEDLRVRVSFAGGVVDDPAYLDSLFIVGYRDNEVDNDMFRTVTISHPAALRNDREPNLYRDDNGVLLNGGTLTIGPDNSAEPEEAWALEVWVKVLSGTMTTNFTGTKFRNGEAYTAPPVGEWSLIHINNGADFAGNITIQGDLIVGQVNLYPEDVDAELIFKKYSGSDFVRYVDSDDVALSEAGTPTKVYTYDWSIDGAG